MVEDEGIVQVFDIDPTPTPTYTPQSTCMISADVTNVRYGGWTDNTYLFVLRQGRAAGKFDINFSPLEELDGVMYDIHAMRTMSPDGMPPGVPTATREDVQVFVWNCRGTARGSFRPNLFTIMSATGCQVIILIETRAAERNARHAVSNEVRETVYRHWPNPVHYAKGHPPVLSSTLLFYVVRCNKYVRRVFVDESSVCMFACG
ncbi:hypothetical protein Cgig2_028556 [Carnegiea gigantea]|uniref:Uncharacterized protein n=1 Tax=Carnegiea gigantea TaxID=171969 RepID=A0A9Q1GLQ8_9CARY|nr:hypothetical protein Cgig2_028556 [Carnegiea gigantea]